FNNVKYTRGYNIADDETDEKLFNEAIDKAKNAEKVILFIGLPDRIESESYDRVSLDLPKNQIDLLNAVYKINNNIGIVLFNGSPVNMDFRNKVKGILEAYLPGQGGGKAIYNLITGRKNFSGVLAESIPEKLSDNPSYLNFPLTYGYKNAVKYSEGINIGYKYYEKKDIKPAFPFSFGLSYTKFQYSDFTVNKGEADVLYKVNLKVKNIGKLDGKKIVTVFTESYDDFGHLANISLKNFTKIFLKKGEEKDVSFNLKKESFSEYILSKKDFEIKGGKYKIKIGTFSSESATPLSFDVKLNPTYDEKLKVDINTQLDLLLDNKFTKPVIEDVFNSIFDTIINKDIAGDESAITRKMQIEMFKSMPLSVLRNSYGYSQEKLDSLIDRLNSV
ncbi:MAG: glycoside hydrolase family 3 C-terminal domain-containing protein, partial [Clostridiales Family XIII bacterium]|nr:glycoside hydrolase family 3 C-terminal domain-containing protein [Clostridiales Family XIII bacterium]